MPYAVNLALRWQIEWLCTYLTISKQLVEMMVGPGRQPVKSTFPVPVPAKVPVPMKTVSWPGRSEGLNAPRPATVSAKRPCTTTSSATGSPGAAAGSRTRSTPDG